jgi:cytochrome P450
MKAQTAVTRAGLPPGPKGTLIGGSIGEFAPRRLDFLLKLAQEYGPISSFRLGYRRVFLITEPDLIEQVLVTDAKYYIKHFGARAYKPVLGNGLVTSEGEFWLRQRRLCQPAFLKHRVLSYIPIMNQLAEQMLAHWTTGKSINVHFEFTNLSSAIALKTLFDLDDPSDRKRFTDMVRLAVDLIYSRLGRLVKFPLWFPTPANLRLRRAVAELNRVIEGFIAAGHARARLGDDLLSRLICAQREDGSRMSDRQLRDETMTLYISAHETTALAISWTWYLLSQHPHVENKLVGEWQRVLGGKSATAEDFARLPYTASVLTESMRLFPPVSLIGREATKDLELGGYRVKRGYTILISPWVSHRDPRYFSDPEQFRPERWEDGLANRIPRYAYYPFSGGQRSCIGNTFAFTEATLALSTVGQRYKFTLDPTPEVKINPQITLQPKHGIPATLQSRDAREVSFMPPKWGS